MKRKTPTRKFLLSVLHSPDVRDYRGSLGNKISLVNIILDSDVWDPWWTAQSASRN